MTTCLFNHYLIVISLGGKYRSSHQRCSVKKGGLRNFSKFTGKHLCHCLFFNKVAGLRPYACNFLKKRLWDSCFPLNFVKILRTSFLQNTSTQLLLEIPVSKLFSNFDIHLYCKLVKVKDLSNFQFPKNVSTSKPHCGLSF